MNKRLENLLIALVLVGLATFVYYAYFLGDKQVGIYEHIRKAEEYFEKGKYGKALIVLHRAYEDLPKSEKMKNILIDGYVKYARHLNAQRDIDMAIDYMDMAYEMAPKSTLVVNELAYLYGKKSIELSEQKDYVLAIRTMQKATDLAVKSKNIRRNIANVLYNGAIDAYNAHDGTTVLLCLNNSYMLWPRFETLQFLGQYFYNDLDLDKALFYWEKALSVRPDDSDLEANIEKVKREIVARKNMHKVETPHFNIQFYGDYNVDIGILRGTLDKIYREVGEDLEYYPPTGTNIVCYTEKDFRDIFGKSGIIRGFYDGSIRIILTVDADKRYFPMLIAHEYTHAIVSIITDNKCPIWLHEGVSLTEQSRYTSASLDNVKAAVREGKKLTIKQLEDGFSQIDHQEIVGLSYEGAYTAVSFILDKWGWSGLRDLLKAIKREGHFTNALDEEFFISVPAFEEMWNEYLEKKY